MQNTESRYFPYRTKAIKGRFFSSILLLKWIGFFKFFTSSLLSFSLLFNLLLPPREQSLLWLSCLPPTTSNLCMSFKMYPYSFNWQQRCRTFLPRRCCKDKAEQESEKLIKCLADILITLFKGKGGRFYKDILWIVNAKNYLMTFILQHLSFRLEIFYEAASKRRSFWLNPKLWWIGNWKCHLQHCCSCHQLHLLQTNKANFSLSYYIS